MTDIFELLAQAGTDEEVNEIYDLTFADMVRTYDITPGDVSDTDDIGKRVNGKRERPP